MQRMEIVLESLLCSFRMNHSVSGLPWNPERPVCFQYEHCSSLALAICPPESGRQSNLEESFLDFAKLPAATQRKLSLA